MGTKHRKRLRIDVSADKESIRTRIDRAGILSGMMPTSGLLQAHPELQPACDALVAAGQEVEDADRAVSNAEAALAIARANRDETVAAYDATYDVCAAQVEQCAVTVVDVTSLGFVVFERGSYQLARPVAVHVSYDIVKALVCIDVDHAPGMQACVIEISPDPIGPTTWSRIPGNGARRRLSGFAPGTYWVRACSMRATGESPFTDPVMVTVR